MKARNFILSFMMMMFCSFAFGQNNHWTTDYALYSGNMSVIAQLSVDGDVVTSGDFEIAAFCGNELRGNQRFEVNGDKYIAYLSVVGESSSELTFRLYDHTAGVEYDNVSSTKETFVIDATLGTLKEPKVIDFNTVAKVGGQKYGSLQAAVNAAAGQTVEIINDVTLSNPVVVNSGLTFDLNQKAITANEGVYPVIRIQNGADVTVTGEGSITNATDYVFTLGSSDKATAGYLTIENGTYVGATSVASVTKGQLNILGGDFSLVEGTTDYRYLINCYDASYKAGEAKVAISGGKFYNFNPEDNAAEGAGTNFLVAGYAAYKNAEDYYVVIEGLIGEGTAENPFRIRNLKELKIFRDHVNAGKTKYNAEGVYVALEADIDMASVDWSVNIGDNCNYTFDGIFDGQNHIISNLKSKETSTASDGYICTGLFGAIYGNAVIKNLTIENVDIQAEYAGNNVAAVVGFVYNGTASIENVTVKNVKIDAPNAYGVGAIVGYSYQSNDIIKNCNVYNANIKAVSGAGAVIGYCGNTDIEGCKVDGAVIEATGLVGGVAGIALPQTVVKDNTVKNVTLTATKAEWVNSTAIAVGTMAGNGLTVANTTYENVNASKIVGSVYAEKPTSVVPAVQARIGNVYYGTFDAALALEGTVEVIDPIVITEDKTYDFTGETIVGEVYPIIRVQNGATLTIEGTGSITNEKDYVFTLGSSDQKTAGNLTINGGTYVGATSVASVTKGQLNILGGDFSLVEGTTDYRYLINCVDANYKNGTAKVAIYGGTFHGWNPEDNAAEGAGTTFCAKNYEAKTIGEDTYIVRRKPAGYVGYRADVTDKADREGIAILLKEVYAFESLVVKVYNNETLMFTCTRRDIDDEDKVMFPVTGTNTTANIVLWGKESGSWINEIHVEPTELNVPNKIEVYSDGVLVDTYTHESGTILGTNLEKYLALDCVKKAVAKIGDTKYMTLAAAVEAATSSQTIEIIADLNENVTITKKVTIDGKGFNSTGLIETKANVTFTFKNFNIEGSSNYFVKANGGGGDIVIEECTVKNGQGLLYVNKSTNKVTVKNVNVDGCNYGVRTVSVNNVALENVKITNTKFGVEVQNPANRNITFKNCNISAETPVSVNPTGKGIVTFYFKEVNDLGIEELNFGEYAKVVADAMVDTKIYEKFDAALAAEGTVKVINPIVITENKTYDFTGETIVGEVYPIIRVQNGATLTIEGTGSITNEKDYVFVLGASDGSSAGNLTIKDGTYKGTTTLASVTKGDLVIEGGVFSINPYEGTNYSYLINCVDANYTNGDATVAISGGKFHNWNPQDNAAEGEHTNFCASGYAASEVEENVWEVSEAVAAIGDKSYSSLQAAIDAAVDGDEVVMLKDLAYSWENIIKIEDNYNVLANVSGKDITLNMNYKKISVDHQSTTDRIYAVVYVADGAGLTVTGNGTIDVDADDTTPKVAYMFWKRGTTGHLTIENGSYHMDNSEDSMVYSNGDDIVTVEDGTFFLDKYGTRENGFPWIFNAAGNNASSIKVIGGTYNYDIRTQHWSLEVNLEGYTLRDNGNGTWTVVKAVAKIGDVYYATLAEAVEAAQADDTVTLLRDATGAGVVIDKNVTIDFGGFTYSFNEGVGSTGTKTNGFQILKGNDVTLMNGTLNVAEEAQDKFYILVQNYSDLTVVDMTLDGTFLDKYSKTDGDSYVLSNNSGNVNIINTTIKANNDGDLAFAFDVCDSKSYTVKPVVYVKGDATRVEGNIEVAGTLQDNLHIQGGTYDFDVEEAGYCDNAYFTKDNGNGTWTVEGPYVAKIGETRYATLAEAVLAATAGQTIEFIANITENVTINKSVTIEGDDFNYTGKMIGNAGLTINIQNVNFVNAGFRKETKSSTGTYNFKQCTFDGEGTYAYPIYFKGAKTVSVENCEVKDYLYGFIYMPNSTTNVNVKNVIVENCSSYAVFFNSGVTNALFENMTVKGSETAVMYNNTTSSRTFTMKNCKMEDVDVAVGGTGETYTVTCKLEGNENDFGGATLNTNAKVVLVDVNATLAAEEADLNVVSGDNDYVVAYVGGVYKLVPASVWNETQDKKYGTLQAAINASNAGDVIKLLANVSYNENDITIADVYGYTVMVNATGKNIVLDLNGNKINTNLEGCTTLLYAVVFVGDNGSLTLRDSSEEGTGAIIAKAGLDAGGKGNIYSLIMADTKNTKNIKMNIESGNYELNESRDSGALVYVNISNILTVTGGNFYLGNAGTLANKSPWIFNTYLNGKSHVIVKGGNYNVTPLQYHGEVVIPEGYTIVKTDNVKYPYSVLPSQTVEFVNGWNWYSSYINYEDLAVLQDALADNATQIKGQNNVWTDYQGDGDWWDHNGFATIEVEKMYLIQTKATSITIGGEVVNPADHPITLQPQWNWIGYQLNDNVSIEEALANVDAVENDQIKTPGFFAIYDGEEWWGSLKTMIAGRGYMYYNASASAKQLVYPSNAAKSRGVVNVSSENNHWASNGALYPNNMTMVAVLGGNDMNENIEVAVFSNGECRGSARPIYVKSADKYMLFLLISGEGNEELTFKYYDINTDEEYVIADRIVYSNDAMLGTLEQPYVLNRGTVGIGENATSMFNIYPNPTATGREISLETTCDMVEVFNSLGVKVAEYRNVDSIDGIETAGVYVIRVTNDNAVNNCRLIVK